MENQVDLYPTERQQKIVDLLLQHGRASVAELSQMFGVSEVTIRADLQTLSAQNLITRTHGGAVLMQRIPELSLTLRRQQQVSEKESIGTAAAELVSNGDAVFLDASSTALALADHLRRHRDLTILTHSLVVAQSMLDAPGVTVVLAGGVLQRDTISLMDTEGLTLLRKFNIKTGFFGAHGWSTVDGLTDVSAGEAEVKREVVAMCRQVVALMDATKWGRVGSTSFANPSQVQRIITDKLAPEDQVAEARTLGIHVTQV
jgi:DeoR family transcriptional regulator, aga operon transcriptional repressor